jgi:hypothetical protein
MARRSRSMPPRPPADFGGIDRYHGGPFALGSRSLKLRWMRVFDRQGRATNLLADRTAPDPPPCSIALPGARHRAPAHQTLQSVDQWPDRAHEPGHQGRHREGLPLREPGKPQGPRPRLRDRLPTPPSTKDPSRPRPALRVPKLPARPRVAPYGKRLFQRAEAQVRCSEHRARSPGPPFRPRAKAVEIRSIPLPPPTTITATTNPEFQRGNRKAPPMRWQSARSAPGRNVSPFR